ncbi:hypothetical protein PHMEG_0002870 [Phytophthora megakarya]|uniref:ZSWIM1/3 RNaseH-like domain-containing protein n=1 Tax=Phytophthora megakarya TaxID=4795 RepID=A0A225WY17_9STRA|nr:hypothetical protein PHMEG_0002870 [Phytophthora megakarya]
MYMRLRFYSIMSGSEPEGQVPPTGVWEIAPLSEEWPEDWPAFKEHMKAHEESTLQLFRMRSSTSVSHRNNDLRGQAPANNCPDPRLISDEFKTYWVKIICTHGWKRKSRSTGQRESYFSKSTECKADVKAAVVWNEQAQKSMVRVTGCNTQHNHRVGRSVYDNHPSVRRVEHPVILAFVNVMQSAGKNVTLRDVHSMVSRMREGRRGSETVEQRLESLLRGFCERRGNRASVYVDDEDLAQGITIQIRQMHRWFKVFPEVMLVDATHNTNESRYKLFSFMIHDVYGHLLEVPVGQYVQHSLMENESAECLTDAISAFKFCNPSWDQVRVIVIDKDMGELSLLEEHFPNAKVILCQFHLKKYIRSEMAKGEYGGPGSFDLDQVEDAVDMILHEVFQVPVFPLNNVHLCEDDPIPDPKHPFLKYFVKNWDHQKERWALYARSDAPHLGNHTNNRLGSNWVDAGLETSWGHIKKILKPEMPLDECVDTLIFLQAVAEMEYCKNITDVGYMRCQGANKEMDQLSREVSTHAYRLIEG